MLNVFGEFSSCRRSQCALVAKLDSPPPAKHRLSTQESLRSGNQKAEVGELNAAGIPVSGPPMVVHSTSGQWQLHARSTR